MHRMERKLAYEHCVAVLNAYCMARGGRDRDFNLSDAIAQGEDAREMVEEAVAYLDWRELLRRDAKVPGLVTVLDEDKIEATR
jgi:hypothetical protein